MEQFDGKVAVITGAASGFGREFARKGAALGMPVNPASDGRLDEKFHACAERIVSPTAASDLLFRLKNIAKFGLDFIEVMARPQGFQLQLK